MVGMSCACQCPWNPALLQVGYKESRDEKVEHIGPIGDELGNAQWSIYPWEGLKVSNMSSGKRDIDYCRLRA